MTTSGEGAEWVEVIPGTSPGPLYQPAPSSQGDPAPQGSWRVHHGTSDGSGNKMGQYGIIWFTIIFSGLVLTWGPLYFFKDKYPNHNNPISLLCRKQHERRPRLLKYRVWPLHRIRYRANRRQITGGCPLSMRSAIRFSYIPEFLIFPSIILSLSI